jgi:murein DD-endopeptidase MepM/ murein hydrolase activator NlpD
MITTTLIRKMYAAPVLYLAGHRNAGRTLCAVALTCALYISLAATGRASEFRYAVDEHPQLIAPNTWRFVIPVGVRPVGELQFAWSQYDFNNTGTELDTRTDFSDRRTFLAIAPTLFNQIDGLINGWDVADMDDGTFSGVVQSTAPLTMVHFGIEADRLVPVLRFPLRGFAPGVDVGLTADSATTSALFDHSMADRTGGFAPYGHDQIVTAYTGASESMRSSKGKPTQLHYDGNPGVDYPAALGTEVYAAASGTVHYPTSMVGLRSGKQACKLYHVMQLIPDAAPHFRVYYLYLSTHPATGPTLVRRDSTAGCPSPVTLPLPEGSHVEAGCLIALSGNAGPKGTPPQLHVEVHQMVPLEELPPTVREAVGCPDDATMGCVPMDPYGWEGDGPDPFESLTGCASTRLWE